MCFFPFGILGKKAFVKKNEMSSSEISNEEVRKNILNNFIFGFIYKTIILFELIVKFNLKIRVPLFLRKVVLSDRTIYDAIIDMGVRFDDPDIFDTFFAKLLIALSPRPRTSFLLVAD